MDKIKAIIDETIRPALKRDGGDLQVVSYKDNVLSIKYQGACGGCPHAAMGTLRFIEQTLKEKVNPDIVVKIA
ncbi:MAG: hypothetical protein A2306_12095 [Omnitrophica WOR_2 bacterium RIFOXYB2_FULL_38_16]|nr:MAG: hypothetical protein A2243_08950 [Omnitrophica WOR_2 bacterium RIFOXYA2_FULL_38_17]OGX51494.1 MAG: hypothetical protein A2267_08790 [Omnitrophica WOR_2 bacterium RIFOXYA12_FULL_38_10]OGX58252.1 MAG: hypothetical protein A2306_12095 [Omnitrophica WOR_2 bacterium RIFOXYB2_FULL_38_16]HBG61850.1 hypothetical protein [Candidatus Omnitrophota bacterium]